MNKNSKRRNLGIVDLRGILKKILDKAHSVPIEKIPILIQHAKQIASIPNDALISPKITNIKSETEKEAKKIVLNFDYFNSEECNFDKIDTSALIKKFKHITSLSLNKFPKSGIERDTIPNKGTYKSLFRRLPPDIDKIKEMKLSEKGRIFYFFIKENFCIISIEGKHRNID